MSTLKRRLGLATGLGALGALASPALALAADPTLKDVAKTASDAAAAAAAATAAADTTWVVVAAVLVLFMQAGFAMLEVGFVRMKNAGTVMAKILVNLGIASIAYWAFGFAIGFGKGGSLFGFDTTPFFGISGWFVGTGSLAAGLQPIAGDGHTYFPGLPTDVAVYGKFLFEFVFCAVSLAIVWGTMLERTKFIVYVIYAIVFAAIIYPLMNHWIFDTSQGWLAHNLGMQDFAGSTVVHLAGATGAFAGLLLLGPRLGKFGKDGRPRIIPGHSMPLAILGVLILWFGWFGFNPGSTLNALDTRFAEVAVVTNIAAGAGVLGAFIGSRMFQKTFDIGMIGNGAVAALVAITAPSGYVRPWAAIIIGLVAGWMIVPLIQMIDRKLDDPIGCLSCHGLAGIWGTLSCGLFTDPALASFNGVGGAGLVYGAGFHQLGVQAVGVTAAFSCVFVLSITTFWLIKKTVGLRVTRLEETDGLDIHEHGMWGYPEQFMPAPGGPYIPPDPEAARQRQERRVRVGVPASKEV
ncbi:MAG: ammonium transporter [Candidatus Dormibacteria bacterium]